MKEDCDRHGCLWLTEKIFEVTGPIAIQFPYSCFMKAMDNGKFVLGAPHGDGEQPSPEEVNTYLGKETRLLQLSVTGCDGHEKWGW